MQKIVSFYIEEFYNKLLKDVLESTLPKK